MLKIFTDLEPFFWDNYKRLGVREYAKLRRISPPTASTLLTSLHNEGMLRREKDHNYILYSVNNDNELFIQLSRAYFTQHLKKIGLVDHLNRELMSPLVILFGSFANAEINEKSDVDIAIFTASNRKPSVDKYRNALGRSIQVFVFKNKDSVKNKELLNNILGGVIIAGDWHHGL